MSSKLIKSIAIAIPALAGVLLVGLIVAFSTLSEEVLTGWLIQAIESETDAEITYQSIRLERGLTTRLDIEQLEVVAHDKSYRVDSSYLRLSVRLPQHRAYKGCAEVSVPHNTCGQSVVV